MTTQFMKIFAVVFAFSTVYSQGAVSAEVVKTCKITMKVPGDDKAIPTTFRIVKEDSGLKGEFSQLINGQEQAGPSEEASIAEYSVRPNLSESSNEMNQAEQLILGTSGILQDPTIGSAFSVGVDLKLIRKAKVYQIGQFTHMGGTAIIEAKNENGEILGSFVTGFLPFACQ